ncbi:right-handed parallel beta-helix repeat-containing protein [Ancylomarina sp. 16SWW S1-10-2]|uniref:right-handed parallel beta-helix repeat-containing protein n=1 Tax=Ancylomarina sp. 16SWW S1-10-2 TaxID=2499681 RepID=UPI0012AEAB72|nr:right-handed parallel beta-helix repeat-containing protein [Ancylomarina sp. 16SWW S1-10-2]MRT94356.1 right-handed parallel beta-helix repeat-containing protein [Ancylomarina sp. 16SWW S1-10-2]
MKNSASIILILLLLFTSCKKENNDSSYTVVDIENLDEDGLPIMDFEVQLPLIADNSTYTIDLTEWDIPTDYSNAIKTTANLQAAIDWAHDEAYSQVILPAGEYLVGEDVNDIYQGGINIYDNTEFIFSEGAIIGMDTNNKWNYCVLSLHGDNIIVRDGVIIGDRDTHIFTPRESDGSTAHDEGHGICIKENNNVLIDNMEIRDLTGDGSLVLESNDVTFTNNRIYNNRRQGISVVGGVRIQIINNEIHHMNGTSPQFGIDIEGAGREDKDILIQNNYFHHNTGGDIVNASGTNVYILDNTMEQGDGSKYVDGPIVSWHKTHNIIARNTITMVDGSVNGRLGYIQYSSGGDKGHNRATYVHDNVMNSCGMYMYKSSGADVRRNKFLGYFVAFSDFENVILIDNLVTYSDVYTNLRYCWSYRFKNATGLASGNYLGDELVEIPLMEKEPYTMQCVVDGW